jgi:hypothetical protein
MEMTMEWTGSEYVLDIDITCWQFGCKGKERRFKDVF